MVFYYSNQIYQRHRSIEAIVGLEAIVGHLYDVFDDAPVLRRDAHGAPRSTAVDALRRPGWQRVRAAQRAPLCAHARARADQGCVGLCAGSAPQAAQAVLVAPSKYQ